MKKHTFFLPLFALILLVTNSQASPYGPKELTIVDVTGKPRATDIIDELADIEFELTDNSGNPAQNVEITLTNKSTGETLTMVARDGVARFTDVPPGLWEVSSAADWVTFNAVQVHNIAAVGAFSAGFASAAAVVGVAGGATTAAVVGYNKVNDDDDDDDNFQRPPLSPSR